MERKEEIVIDASVGVKWYSEEEGTDRALELRSEHIDGTTILIAPDLLIHEIANALRFKPGFSTEVMDKALDDLFDIQMDLMVPNGEVVKRGAQLAFEYDITTYDACYLSLGEILGAEVVTADGRLYEKAKDCGFLRLL